MTLPAFTLIRCISIYAETQDSYGYESAQSSILDTMEANINSNPEDFVIDKENVDMIFQK